MIGGAFAFGQSHLKNVQTCNPKLFIRQEAAIAAGVVANFAVKAGNGVLACVFDRETPYCPYLMKKMRSLANKQMCRELTKCCGAHYATYFRNDNGTLVFESESNPNNNDLWSESTRAMKFPPGVGLLGKAFA
jgi:hypothetical protein